MPNWTRIAVEQTSGSVTMPAESGAEEIVKELCRKWGADYIRDSDGTSLSPELLSLGYKIYSTICLVRADQEWTYAHPDQLHQKFLMSDPITAVSNETTIYPMKGFCADKYRIDEIHDPKKYWEVFDRTTGELVPADDWNYEPNNQCVVVHNCIPWHIYTVNFLVFQTWDTTSMYNYLTNGWTGRHVMSSDPYNPETYSHLMRYFDEWLAEHPQTDLVRLTTLAYHFAVDSDCDGADKMRDWTGYQDTISIKALEDFELEYGYGLTSEDFVDSGYYNNSCRTPSKKILDWMDFIHRFVARFCRDICDRAHASGKKTGMFWGDHWIGAEPYLDSFEEMGIDVHIGACEDGVALRRIADSPGNHIRECRLYPYFFPDVFSENGNPLGESINNWLKIRRALLRKPIDRIGYGGYPSLAAKFPEFVEHVEDICCQFREIKRLSQGSGSWRQTIRVAVLTAWGKRRSWLPMYDPAQKFMEIRADTFWVAGSNLLECLSGLPVEVCFISCDEVANNGVPNDIDVIINDGAAETSWSGGSHWANPSLQTAVRKFVGEGGGIIGCRGPSAFPKGGRYFQLSDVFGVDKEIGQSILCSRVPCKRQKHHFITDDNFTEFDFGIEQSWIYSSSRNVHLLIEKANHTMLAVNNYYEGRSVYFAGLPYSTENCRMLYRAILWVSKREHQLNDYLCTNFNCEAAYYPYFKTLAVANNTQIGQQTAVSLPDGSLIDLELGPCEIAFFRN